MAALTARNPVSRALVSPDCRIYGDLEDMLADGGLDGVIVATPTPSHYPVTARVLETGLAALVEKPLTNDPNMAANLQRTAKSCGLVAHVNHIDLTNPAWRAVRRLLPAIGPLQRLRGSWVGDGPLRPDTPGRWDYGSHAVAVAIDAAGGEPDTVEARRIESRGDSEVVEAKFSWKHGVRATLEIGNAAPEKQRHIVIEGATGTLQYDDTMETKAFKDGVPLAFSMQSPLTAAVLCFAKAIRSEGRNYDSIDLGVSVVSTLARLDQAGGF